MVVELPDGLEFVVENFSDNFKWSEYIVFAAVLLASLGIGVFYGCFGSKNKSNEEFLMAGRSMSITPVTLSLVCSFVSAVTLLGNPVEVYYYGQIYTIIGLSFIPITLALAFWYVPVYFKLQLTSAYEYFEWRFSRRVRVMCSIFAIVHMTFYMPITVLGPSLAIDQVAGFRYEISAAAIFLVCIAYSSLGGLKAVLWTDALQAVVMIGALASVAICGVIELNGFAYVWERSAESDRTDFYVGDPDPRTRHTFWTGTLGGYFLWLPLFAATQAQIQRYNSVPTLAKSRICLVFNMIGMQFVIVVCSFMGMLIYAKYYDCNPIDNGAVTSADQLLPLFVMDVLRDYPVIPGLLVAGITCGSLSSVSSALNSLTAIVTEDFVKHSRPDWSDEKLGLASKIISTVTGIIAFGLVFVVKLVNGTINLSPFSTLIHGSLLGPILGAFSLGMFVPWSNNLGVFIGMIFSIIITGFVGIGNIFASRAEKVPDMKLSLSIENCVIRQTTKSMLNSSYSLAREFLVDSPLTSRANTEWKAKHSDDSFVLKLWSLSYIWQPGIGCITTLIFGGIFSAIVIAVNRKSIERVHKNLLSQPWLRFWEKIFGKEKLSEWVDYNEEETFRKNPVKSSLKPGSNKDIDLDTYAYGTIPKAKINEELPPRYGQVFDEDTNFYENPHQITNTMNNK